MIEGEVNTDNDERAKSRAEWRRLGYKPIVDLTGQVFENKDYLQFADDYVPGEYCWYYTYRRDQVVELRKCIQKPASTICIFAAIWTITRYAKRCRDAAQTCYQSGNHAFAKCWSGRKADAYDLKGQALHYLIQEGMLTLAGFHRFGEDGNVWSQKWQVDGYSFHIPCPPPDPAPEGAAILDDIEAHPKGSSEPRLKDAQHTLQEYLGDKQRAAVYKWPTRMRSQRVDTRICPCVSIMGETNPWPA